MIHSFIYSNVHYLLELNNKSRKDQSTIFKILIIQHETQLMLTSNEKYSLLYS